MNAANKKILKNIFFINLFILINYIFYILNFSLFLKLNTLIIFFLFSFIIFLLILLNLTEHLTAYIFLNIVNKLKYKLNI